MTRPRAAPGQLPVERGGPTRDRHRLGVSAQLEEHAGLVVQAERQVVAQARGSRRIGRCLLPFGCGAGESSLGLGQLARVEDADARLLQALARVSRYRTTPGLSATRRSRMAIDRRW